MNIRMTWGSRIWNERLSQIQIETETEFGGEKEKKYFANYVEKIKQTEIESEGQNMDKWKEEFIKEVYNDETVMMEIYDEIMKQVHAFWRNLRIILIPWKMWFAIVWLYC